MSVKRTCPLRTARYIEVYETLSLNQSVRGKVSARKGVRYRGCPLQGGSTVFPRNILRGCQTEYTTSIRRKLSENYPDSDLILSYLGEPLKITEWNLYGNCRLKNVCGFSK